MDTGRIVRFGLFEFDRGSLELRRAGRPIRLAPQPARALAALLRRHGQVVTREELAKDVWGDQTFVDFDQGLNFCVRQIRSALGDSADSPRYVETLPRRGYRFVAPVEPIAETDRPDRPAAPAAAVPPRASRFVPVVLTLLVVTTILGYGVWARVRAGRVSAQATVAVLPFDDLSGRDQAYFADGISEELATDLGRTDPALTVIGRTSMRPFRNSAKTAAEIGREVGAAYLIDGTVRRSGARIRVTAELIRAADQTRVWSDAFEADATEILVVQQQMGLAIARQVLARVSPAARGTAGPVDPVVYDLYLQGRAHWNRRIYQLAQDSFAAAIARDPGFARGYAGLGDSVMGTRNFTTALAYADRALAIDNRLAEAYVTRGHALLHLFRWKDAEAAFRDAVAIDPSLPQGRYFLAEFLVAAGRPSEAVKEAQVALAVDPLSAITTHAAGVVMYYAGEYDDARTHLSRAHELDPTHTWTEVRLALVDERQQAFADAIAAFDRLGRPIRGAYAFALGGRPDEARRQIAAVLALPDTVGESYHLAGAYTGLGEYAEAMKWLQIAVRTQAYDAIYTAVDPRLLPLHARADYRALLAEAGWPGEVSASHR